MTHRARLIRLDMSELDKKSELESDLDSDLDPPDEDPDGLSSPLSSPAESPESGCKVACDFESEACIDSSAPLTSEFPTCNLDTEAGKQITKASGIIDYDATEQDRGRLLGTLASKLLTDPDSLAEELSAYRRRPVLSPTAEEDDALRIIDAASRMASQKATLEKGDWKIDEEAESSQGEQASKRLVEALLIEGGVYSDGW